MHDNIRGIYNYYVCGCHNILLIAGKHWYRSWLSGVEADVITVHPTVWNPNLNPVWNPTIHPTFVTQYWHMYHAMWKHNCQACRRFQPVLDVYINYSSILWRNRKWRERGKWVIPAKTTFQRTSKGSLGFSDCPPDGKFVRIENTGSKV